VESAAQARGGRARFDALASRDARNRITLPNEGQRGSWLPDSAAAKSFLDARTRARQIRSDNAEAIDSLQFLRINDVCQLLRISKPTLWRLRKASGFSEPTEVTDRLIAWLATRHSAGRGASTRPPRIALNEASKEAPANAPRKVIQERQKTKRVVQARVTPPLDDKQLPLLLKRPK
jgi:predicted DNA-binding transcriptional regulator AlpA